MAAAEDMELHQIDIKGAYLNGELTTTWLMKIERLAGLR
jgi:hypothetical protein